MTTPLASIFGSGFLVIVSVLGGSVGALSVLAMAGICALAYAVGAVVRHNIRRAEPVLAAEDTPRRVAILSIVAQLALIPAYVISVTLYIRILASYGLGFFKIEGMVAEQLLTTGVIVVVLAIGVTKGLNALEAGGKWALALTIGIMLLLLAAFGFHDAKLLATSGIVLPAASRAGVWQIVTTLAGTLIVVQGFETTRYLGGQFDADTRVRAARDAQIVSTVVYLLFVASATPLLHYLPRHVADNSLMQLAGIVAIWLTYPLVAIAIFSQLSAAIADVIGGSGSLIEVSQRALSTRATYFLICLSAIALCWATTTLTILALASRAFAFYYLMQCLVAISVSNKMTHKLLFGAVGMILAFITVFAVPVG
jgi:hypothetical protein